ncbi:hypothetical protein JIN84_17770 [Luteolibacter yonseiensis]|uniref:Uncharacterized protein n=1 Tax=Luteolibacter yonseiensis TaxID=1144680 RepID=A0A934R320_9BACT|nr:hypothetical protein [Luteolibacter yonseiensis]MBK1817473.1 hypothetical protein [Luteolibacter yonseiensis]
MAASPSREAPNPQAVAANQLTVAGNACGPTALLNSFRFGTKNWQRASLALGGENDKQRIQTIIRRYGMRPSNHINGRARWSKKGVNIADLEDIANEMTVGQALPIVRQDVLFLKQGESQEKLLKRVHYQLNTSLAKGLPPVLSIRRYAKRGKGGEWIVLDAHFVTLTSIPRKLEKGARSFPVTYVDPWGGKTCQGSIGIPARAILSDAPVTSPCLEAVFPQASVGRKLARPGEPTALTLAAMLGRW